MFPNLDELAHGDKEPIPATALLALLPATSTALVRRAERVYGLSGKQTMTLIYELRRDQQVTQNSDGVYIPVRIEK